MAWKEMGTLSPNRLAMLCFGEMKTGRWIGYVDHNGVCQWPASVSGLRPTGWQEVMADLAHLGLEGTA